MELFRDSAMGQIIRRLTNDKILLYSEEEAGADEHTMVRTLRPISKHSSPADTLVDTKRQNLDDAQSMGNKSQIPSQTDEEMAPTDEYVMMAPAENLQNTMLKTEQNAEGNNSSKGKDVNFVVEWYSDEDPENPQNWTGLKKAIVLFQLCAYTMAVYGASSMYVAGEEDVIREFHIGATPAALGLAVYVAGYGIGPLVFAPLSEIASVGRNWVYIPTFFLFAILSIPTATVKNFAGLLVLRFLTGFFGSPCLANGGASVGDIVRGTIYETRDIVRGTIYETRYIYPAIQIPIYLSCWTAVWFWGPAIGPVVAGFAVQAKGWRWGLWKIVWLTAPLFLLLSFALPETSADNILHRRAARLRKITGRKDIFAASEIAQAQLTTGDVVWDALIKPMEIMIKDPAVLFTNIYTSLTYGIYYSFFEAFPLVYPQVYGFNIGETGLCFLTIGIACLIGIGIFYTYQFCYLLPEIRKNGPRAPEHRLVPALFAVITLSAGYFMFGWTVRSDIHWIVSLIGVVILVTSNFLIFQSVFVYLPMSYPKYAASLFAANDLCRSVFAVACILFARPMFENLGIGGGVSLLAGLSCLGIAGMFALWKYGAWLRSKSSFANS